jgi:hypothetical protein
MPSVFGTRRRLPISATATTYGHSARSSHDPRRDGHLDALPFLNLPRPLPCGSGDRRRAAHRPSIQTPVPVPPGFHQVFPTAIPASTRHLRGLLRRSASGDQRARVRGPSEGRVICRSTRETVSRVSRVRCMRFEECMRTFVPFLSALWTSAVAGAFAERGGDPFSTPDRTKIYVPTLTREGQRHPADRDAFHRQRPRRAFDRRIAPPTKSRASVPRSRRPHVLH